MNIDKKNLRKADILWFLLGIAVVLCAVLGVLRVKQGKPFLSFIPQKTTIVFAQWWNGTIEKGALPAIIADFEKENPLIKVKLADSAWEDIRDALTSENSSFADIVAVDMGHIEEITAQGFLEEIITAENENTVENNFANNNSEIETISENENSAESENYIIEPPLYAKTIAAFLHPLFYNISILENCGFSRPPKTREEFLAYAKKIKTDMPEISPFGLSRNVRADVLPWILTAGAQSPEISSWTGRSAVDSLKFFTALSGGDLLYPMPLAKREDELLDAFIEGNLAMFISSQASAAEIRARAPALVFDVTAIPQSETAAGGNVFAVTEWGLGIPSKSANKEAARKLLDYLSERRADIADAARGMAGLYAASGKDDAFVQKLRALYASSQTISGAAYSDAVLLEMREYLAEMLSGAQTEAETAGRIAAAMANAAETNSRE